MDLSHNKLTEEPNYNGIILNDINLEDNFIKNNPGFQYSVDEIGFNETEAVVSESGMINRDDLRKKTPAYREFSTAQRIARASPVGQTYHLNLKSNTVTEKEVVNLTPEERKKIERKRTLMHRYNNTQSSNECFMITTGIASI